ncbi:MAG: O-antigen ligase family protein [Chloroflexi bacterium]|nr:O-antigen ligase family protein [Chloroflexota bacterium]
MPLIVSTQTIFPFIVGKAIYSRIIIALVFGLWAALAFRNASFRPPRSRLILVLCIYLFISLLAGTFGVSFQRSLWSTFERMQGVVDLAHWVALLIVLASVVRTNTNWLHLLNANMAVSLLVALVGLGQGFEVESIPFYPFLQADARVGSTLGNSAFVGTYMILNAIIALGLLLRSFWPDEAIPPTTQVRRRRSRRREQESKRDLRPFLWQGFWIVVVLVNLWVMTLTGTRGAVIGLIAGIGFFSAAYVIVGNQATLKRSLAVLVGSIVLLGILTIVLRDTPIVRSVASNNVLVDLRTDQNPFTSRLFALTVGYKALLEKPILGWGPENYIVPYGRYYVEGTSSFEVLDQAHNKPIEELVTKGILGLASYLAIWFFIFRIIFQRARHVGQRNQIFVLTVASALAAYFVQNLFLFDTPVSTLQFVIFAAIVVGLEAAVEAHSLDADVPSPTRISTRIRTYGSDVLGPVKHILGAVKSNPGLWSSLSIAGLFATFALVMLSLWFNIRAYSAAGTIIEVTRGASSLDTLLATVDRSINTFPPLANYPRLIYIRNVATIWPNLPEADAQRILELADTQAIEARAAEPENWRIYLSMGDMYRDVAGQSASFEGLDTARYYLDVAEDLAPQREEVVRLRRRVEALEKMREVSSQQ